MTSMMINKWLSHVAMVIQTLRLVVALPSSQILAIMITTNFNKGMVEVGNVQTPCRHAVVIRRSSKAICSLPMNVDDWVVQSWWVQIFPDIDSPKIDYLTISWQPQKRPLNSSHGPQKLEHLWKGIIQGVELVLTHTQNMIMIDHANSPTGIQ